MRSRVLLVSLQLLFDDFDCHTTPHVWEIHGLEAGTYEIFTYAIGPDDAGFKTFVTLADAEGNLDDSTSQLVGGAYEGALVEGGMALMPLDKHPWSDCYAWVQDRFGVSWQVMQTGRKPDDAVIAPCLMFTGGAHGQAEAAIRFYPSALPDSRIERIEKYTADEGVEGTVKHGRFRVCGTQLVAMDAHQQNNFKFSEALSLQVLCDTQDDVDRVWSALTEGGREGPCGWLTDRFGFAWQVVPRALRDMMTSDDEPARARAFSSFMPMKKLDIATLEPAFRGA
jgi:predicted 3-demethylubiquinone-9 3-methyltransferase (glyoxalase superfamily)